MKRPDPLLFSLQELVVDLALIDRKHFLTGKTRRENDIEHSFSVMILCWYIYSKNNLDLDLAKILKYAAAHDFVERYAGDTNTFASRADREKKIELERESLERLCKELVGFEDLIATMQNYEDKTDDESLFVWTVDKMQALILGDLDNWRPYQELRITYETFENKYAEQLTKCSPYCKEVFEAVVEYCKTTYYDQSR